MGAEAKNIQLHIAGMVCTNCQKIIAKELNGLNGIQYAKVSYRTGTADIIYDSTIVTHKQIKGVIEKLGYSVSRQNPMMPAARAGSFLAIIILLFILLDRCGVLNLLVPSQLADNTMGFGMLFLVGLATSVHCIAMCGGINLSQCLPSGDGANQSRFAAFRPALLYNLGRVISYTVIGFLLGFIGMILGAGTDTGVSLLLQGAVKIIAGILMVIMGLGMLGLFPNLRRLSIHMPKALGRRVGKAKSRTRRPLIVGLLNGLMPCGPLQSMQIVALASGNPLTGALSMLLFSLGTAPLMLGFGSLVSALGQKFARTVTTVGAVLVVVLGLAMLSQGGNLSGLLSFPTLLAAVIALSVVGVVSLMPYKRKAGKTACVALSACICLVVFAVFVIWKPSAAAQTAGGNDIEIIDGVQVVHSTLGPGRYPDITVQAGLPVRWIIDAPSGSINGCNNRIIIQAYGIEHTFTTGENTIEFMPDRAGDISYSCWMGMIYGNIHVIEQT